MGELGEWQGEEERGTVIQAEGTAFSDTLGSREHSACGGPEVVQ